MIQSSSPLQFFTHQSTVTFCPYCCHWVSISVLFPYRITCSFPLAAVRLFFLKERGVPSIPGTQLTFPIGVSHQATLQARATPLSPQEKLMKEGPQGCHLPSWGFGVSTEDPQILPVFPKLLTPAGLLDHPDPLDSG